MELHIPELAELKQYILSMERKLDSLTEEVQQLRNGKEWYTVKDFAERIGRSEDFVRNLCIEEKIVFSQEKPKAAIRFHYKEVLEFERKLNGQLPLPMNGQVNGKIFNKPGKP